MSEETGYEARRLAVAADLGPGAHDRAQALDLPAVLVARRPAQREHALIDIEEAVARVRTQIDKGDWDLSPNDEAALALLCDHVERHAFPRKVGAVTHLGTEDPKHALADLVAEVFGYGLQHVIDERRAFDEGAVAEQIAAWIESHGSGLVAPFELARFVRAGAWRPRG